jgi:hypothetical protein
MAAVCSDASVRHRLDLNAVPEWPAETSRLLSDHVDLRILRNPASASDAFDSFVRAGSMPSGGLRSIFCFMSDKTCQN